MRRSIALACALTCASLTSSAAAEPDAEEGYVASPVCSSPAIARAHDRAAPAIVGVVAPGLHALPMAGVGFVYGSPRFVATALSLVENGRGIEVVVGEDRYDAVVQTVSQQSGLALLRLERPIAADPLEAETEELSVGEPVLALGRTSYGPDGDVVVAPGIVTGRGQGRYRTDALDALGLRWGTPLLDCSGAVVGIATRYDEVTPSAALNDLRRSTDAEAEPYDGTWSFGHPSFAMAMQADHGVAPGARGPDAWLGVETGIALIGRDRWVIPLEFRTLLLAGPQRDSPLLNREGLRLQLATGLGYRIMLSGGDLPIYLTPSVGATVDYTQIAETPIRATLGADCGSAGGGCTLDLGYGDPRETRAWRVLPHVGLDLNIGPMTMGYQFQLDPTNVAASVHQLTMGFQF